MKDVMERPSDGPMESLVYFYEGISDQNGVIEWNTHHWGQLNCIDSGIASFSSQGNRLIGLPGVGIWFPPGVYHECFNHRQLIFKVMNVDHRYCRDLPTHSCMIGLSDIFQSIWEYFFKTRIQSPSTTEDVRLGQVLLDQLKTAPAEHFFLPTTDDPLLLPIVRSLEDNPGNNSSLSFWAETVFSTERTLARRFQTCLGMSFREWRLRLRFLHSIALLSQGQTIESVALGLGYSTSSAFIHMFSKIAGISPERYRRNQAASSATAE